MNARRFRFIGFVAAAASAACPSAVPDDVLFIRGSDTMRPLVEAWGERFSGSSRTDIVFSGGGSGIGIYALLNGMVDICASSRPMTSKERRVALRKALTVFEFEVALDGIAVVVHPSNPVADLSMAQLAEIFTGTSTSWQAVGGPPVPIAVLSRERHSGTHHFFRRHALGNEDYTAEARILPSTAAVVRAVAVDPRSVGYVGLGFAQQARQRVRIIPIHRGDAGRAWAPSAETVASGDYPLSRALYFYTVVPPSGEVARFIEYVRSPEGQRLVTAARFVPTGRAASEDPPRAASSAPAGAGLD